MAQDLFWTTSSPMEIALLAGIEGNEIKAAVMLAPAQGVLPRGSIIKEDGSNGNWVLVATAPAATDRLAVLGTTVDTGAAGTTEEILVDAYLSGLFNRAAISFGGAITLTSANEEILRGKGIFLDTVVPATGAVPIHG